MWSSDGSRCSCVELGVGDVEHCAAGGQFAEAARMTAAQPQQRGGICLHDDAMSAMTGGMQRQISRERREDLAGWRRGPGDHRAEDEARRTEEPSSHGYKSDRYAHFAQLDVSQRLVQLRIP